jgi:hypothetical protein
MNKLFKELGINEHEYEMLKERFLREDSELPWSTVTGTKNWFKRRYEEGASNEMICKEVFRRCDADVLEYVEMEIADIIVAMKIYIEGYRKGREEGCKP